MNIIDDLNQREIIYQCTNIKELKKKCQNSICLYAGFDPTAESLHLGNLFIIVTLRRFQLAGHKVIALVGGGTGLIGDPSGKSEERQLNPEEIVAKWSEKIKNQLQKFLDFDNKNKALLENNYNWLKIEKLIPFLRDIGKHFPINEMLDKESVKSRFQTGISYTEFSYMLLQAYDYLKLYQKYNCILQIGGSDQWGNITAGTDLIRKKLNKEAYGLTLPLITKSDGTKFGKSEKGAIWLDKEKTIPYHFYQFWINTDDKDVIKLLKYYTFLSMTEIEELKHEIKTNPEKRTAQKTLAKLITEYVHGKHITEQLERISSVLFGENVNNLKEEDFMEMTKIIPTVSIQENELLEDILVKSNLASSKRQAREFIANKAVNINGKTLSNKTIDKSIAVYNKYLLIKRGKKNYALGILS